MSLTSKLLLQTPIKKCSFQKFYKNSKIHNQSYIYLNDKYEKLQKKNNNLHIKLKNQNDLILKLKTDNNKLLDNNQELKNQLLQKERFINLNLYTTNKKFTLH